MKVYVCQKLDSSGDEYYVEVVYDSEDKAIEWKKTNFGIYDEYEINEVYPE